MGADSHIRVCTQRHTWEQEEAIPAQGSSGPGQRTLLTLTT